MPVNDEQLAGLNYVPGAASLPLESQATDIGNFPFFFGSESDDSQKGMIGVSRSILQRSEKNRKPVAGNVIRTEPNLFAILRKCYAPEDIKIMPNAAMRREEKRPSEQTMGRPLDFQPGRLTPIFSSALVCIFLKNSEDDRRQWVRMNSIIYD